MSSHFEVNANVAMTQSGKTDGNSDAREFYKLEYERAAQRYNEIYTDIWTNFSYMALLAGGILTFGSNFLKNDPNLTALLACTPLFFWYMASFLPMNRYGDQVHQRLKRIESIADTQFEADLQHFRNFKHSESKTTWGKQLAKPSVRCMILLFFVLLSSVAGLLLFRVYKVYLAPSKLLQSSDLKQPANLADQLQNRKDTISEYILVQEASKRTRNLLADYKYPEAPSDELKESLTNDLNRLIARDRLSEVTDFSRVQQRSPETRRLEDQKNLADGELVLLNRLLLADAYPQQIAKYSQVQSYWLVVFVVVCLLVSFIAIWGTILGYKQVFGSGATGPGMIKIELGKPTAAFSVSYFADLKKFLKRNACNDTIQVITNLNKLEKIDQTPIKTEELEKQYLDNNGVAREGVVLIVGTKKTGKVVALKLDDLQGLFDKLTA